MRKIAPSILSAYPLNLEDQISRIEKETEILHIDIMDGHFVPNLTFGPHFIKALKKRFDSLLLDVHLMVYRPETIIEWYLEAGADWVSFHIEANPHHHRYLMKIKESGAKAGLALNPTTSLCLLEPALPYVDFVLLLTVNPGFGGQKFIPEGLEKISRLKEMREKGGYDFLIEVDGGIKSSNIKEIFSAGTDIAVAGSAVFHGDPLKNLLELKEAAL